jgi:hypothetical protein
MSREAELAVLERLADAAQRFRSATVRAVDRLNRRAEPEYRSAASLLDSELHILAKLRGKPVPWPLPPRAEPGALVVLERDGQTYAGYVESISPEGIAECAGVRRPDAPGGIAVFCRWSAALAEVRVLT